MIGDASLVGSLACSSMACGSAVPPFVEARNAEFPDRRTFLSYRLLPARRSSTDRRCGSRLAVTDPSLVDTIYGMGGKSPVGVEPRWSHSRTSPRGPRFLASLLLARGRAPAPAPAARHEHREECADGPERTTARWDQRQPFLQRFIPAFVGHGGTPAGRATEDEPEYEDATWLPSCWALAPEGNNRPVAYFGGAPCPFWLEIPRREASCTAAAREWTPNLARTAET